MKIIVRCLVLFVVVFSLVVNALPCGPSETTPVFEYDSTPENPYENFAAGKLGIIKPGFHRSVLFAAYRYINGGGFLPDEQKALIDVWKADFDNKDYLDTDITDAVRSWVAKRQEVVGKEEKTPDIYTERNYAGYDFFPNSAKNAFETATETLNDRMSSHGPSDPGVLDWVKGQDEVFQNSSSGKQSPGATPPGSPDWLQKDRNYQIAAAAFYSMDYEGAKRRFAEIAQDADSPWAETADYLVARTLVRQASLSKNEEKSAEYYEQAEQRLQKFTSGKFAESAERILGLIAYRIHPKERVRELAGKLMIPAGNSNFRQDVIDFTWLTDKFEDEVLTAEQQRKEEQRQLEDAKNGMSSDQMTGTAYANRLNQSNAVANANAMAGRLMANAVNEDPNRSVADSMNAAANAMNAAANAMNVAANAASQYKYHNGPSKVNDDDIQVTVYSSDDKENWSFYVPANATDDEAIAAAEKLSGKPLSDEIKERIRDARRSGYVERFSRSQTSGHQIYYGSEKMKVSLLPDYLRSSDLTEWLFVYPIQDTEAYLYSLNKYRQTNSDLWLMTALSKANKNSTQLIPLLSAASKTSHMSPAWQTIAYYHAHLLLDLGRNAEAKKLLDDILNGPDELTISARNQFMALRLKLADSLDDFLKYSLRKPFAFDFDGETGTIQEFIDQEKGYYDPKNSEGKTREQYDREVEDRFKNELAWQDRVMFDDDTITVLNDHFPLAALVEVERSPVLPDYLRERFAVAIWTRAVLVDDYPTAAKIAPELARLHPELAVWLSNVTNAKTPAQREGAVLYLLIKNPNMTPDISGGMAKEPYQFDDKDPEGSADFTFGFDLWWCAPYETEYDENAGQELPKKVSPRPTFLTSAQDQAVKAEQAKLKAIGDAPKYLGEKVLEWAKRSPLDRRIPESLYIAYEANGWTKYGCGSNDELHDGLGRLLKLRYPQSDWSRRVLDEEKEK